MPLVISVKEFQWVQIGTTYIHAHKANGEIKICIHDPKKPLVNRDCGTPPDLIPFDKAGNLIKQSRT